MTNDNGTSGNGTQYMAMMQREIASLELQLVKARETAERTRSEIHIRQVIMLNRDKRSLENHLAAAWKRIEREEG